MKIFDERLKCVTAKIEILQNKRKRRKLITRICWIVVLIILALVLFIPYKTDVPDVSVYADSPYYSLIQYLNESLCEKPAYANNFEWVTAKSDQLFYWLIAKIKGYDTQFEDWALNTQTGFVPNDADILLGDRTGNVLEGELIYGDEYIYCIDGGGLKIYSIAGPSSELIADYQINSEDGMKAVLESDSVGMCLSEDQTILHIITPCNDGVTSEPYVGIINLDVSDPEHISESNRVYITGNVISAQTDEEDILVAVNFSFDSSVDFSDESTFLPQIGRLGNMNSVAAEDIILPGQLSDTCYTVVCRLDGKTLAVHDSRALLSYFGVVQITDGYVYAARVYANYHDFQPIEYVMTELSILGRTQTGFEFRERMTLEGAVKQGNFLNEYDGILRVVTVPIETPCKWYWYGRQTKTILHCVSMENWKVIASAESRDDFNTATVNFVGNSVYLAKDRPYLSQHDENDTVYWTCVMDMSDLSNITVSDFLTIAQYNDLYLEFGSNWVGIRRIERIEDAVTVYQETDGGLVGLSRYVLNNDDEDQNNISSDPDTYLIDSEKQLIGLSVYNGAKQQAEYWLLQFSYSALREDLVLRKVGCTAVSGNSDDIRALVIGEYVYLFGGELAVLAVK